MMAFATHFAWTIVGFFIFQNVPVARSMGMNMSDPEYKDNVPVFAGRLYFLRI